MKKNIALGILLFLGINFMPQAQGKAGDSIVINVGNESRITINIKNRKDLETLKQYNFQLLMDDFISKIEARDTASALKPSSTYINEPNTVEEKSSESEIETENRNKPEPSKWEESRDETEDTKEKFRGTRQSVSFDIGTNNYLSDGNFTDSENELYTVRPWGSWYLAANSVHRTRISRTFFLEWGMGLSMYNFKFQNDSVHVGKSATQVEFTTDKREVDFRKSKLSSTYINASFIPVFDFGGNRRKPVFFDGRRSDSFRFGFGPYAGYRLDSFTKMVYKEDGEKRKEKDRDNYYLNNIRYGLRLQLGFRDTDLFFNYDMNNLFADNKGPGQKELNAFSFGVSF